MTLLSLYAGFCQIIVLGTLTEGKLEKTNKSGNFAQNLAIYYHRIYIIN